MDCCGVARRLDWTPHLTHHFNPKLNKLQGFSFLLLLDGWIRNGAGEIHVSLRIGSSQIITSSYLAPEEDYWRV
jgi:hypothetical protein